MTALELQLIYAFDVHSVEEVRAVLDAGLDPRLPIEGKTPINRLTEAYLRSDRFPECLRLLLDRGAVLDDPILLPVLLNDAGGLAAALDADPCLLEHRTTMISSFTPLIGATLLHVAAEYGHLNAARVLVEKGADVNATAARDEYGLNGHTPLFHTVNSHDNRSEPIMRLLLEAGAKADVRLAGLVWGQGYDWETTFFDVTPISYCQCGLLPQVHRREQDIYANIGRLLEAAGRTMPPLENVPNRYLQPKAKH
ncbi:MAG TPA: ankyrin repeat domain-containing protein [Chthonomonadaceae bacterium]|nr:ankyrin repeat domain-containing protein [Chthonomonadaceae bacterium]